MKIEVDLDPFLWEGIKILASVAEVKPDTMLNATMHFYIDNVADAMGVHSAEDARRKLRELENGHK